MSSRSSTFGKPCLRDIYGKSQRIVVGAAAVTAFLLLWQTTALTNPFLAKYVSSPAASLAAGWTMFFQSSFRHDLSVSSLEFGLGFLAAVATGLIIGAGMGLNKRIAYLLEPLVMALNATPHMALIPILIVWFGIGLASKIAVVFLGAVIPVIINTMVGIQDVDAVLLRAARSFGARKQDVYFKIIFPSCLPAIMAGVRLGIGRGILGVIIAEMYVAVAGVGHAMMLYGQAIRVNELIFMIALVSFFGFVLVTLVAKVEKRLAHWK